MFSLYTLRLYTLRLAYDTQYYNYYTQSQIIHKSKQVLHSISIQNQMQKQVPSSQNKSESEVEINQKVDNQSDQIREAIDARLDDTRWLYCDPLVLFQHELPQIILLLVSGDFQFLRLIFSHVMAWDDVAWMCFFVQRNSVAEAAALGFFPDIVRNLLDHLFRVVRSFLVDSRSPSRIIGRVFCQRKCV